MTRVLLAGVSTRGFAESAARAGYEVVAVDGFGDLDLRACAAEVRVAHGDGRFSAREAARAARAIPCDAVAYTAPFENHPPAVRALAQARALWGNPPRVLARVRNPYEIARVLASNGHRTAAVRTRRPPAHGQRRWLLKPRASGGGSGITRWRPGQRVSADRYLQERIVGVPGSIVFASDGRRITPLGVSRLLVGDRAFGATGFRYCGNILWRQGASIWRPGGPELSLAVWMAEEVARRFGLVGVNGVDFVVHGRRPYLIEVNPRYTASMELIEQACGLSIFQVHVDACTGRLAPSYPEVLRVWEGDDAFGKAVVYAKRDVIVGETRAWLEDDGVRDIPISGQRIVRGAPVCTVFARGEDPELCYSALVRRAAAVYREIEGRQLRLA